MAAKKKTAKKSPNKKKKSYTFVTIVTILLLVIAAGGLWWAVYGSSDDSAEHEQTSIDTSVPPRLLGSALEVDYSQSSIDLADVLSGGPGKDGIPALTDPGFVRQADSTVADDTQVIVVEHNGEVKIYPYSILVWHEIANDTVGGKPLAVTFCPLCGSAIVFEREVDGQVLDFGVSGFLFESNLLMYSREDSESLWSQSRGEAVVGQRTGTELTHFPLQLMTFAEAKSEFPAATVLSDKTGYNRDYTGNPYAGYDETEQTIFPVSVNDMRFPAKEVFFIVPLEGNSIAVRQDKSDGSYPVPDSDIIVTFDRGQITARWGDAELPGYYEMWFSWATHNQDNGTVL